MRPVKIGGDEQRAVQPVREFLLQLLQRGGALGGGGGFQPRGKFLRQGDVEHAAHGDGKFPAAFGGDDERLADDVFILFQGDGFARLVFQPRLLQGGKGIGGDERVALAQGGKVGVRQQVLLPVGGGIFVQLGKAVQLRRIEGGKPRAARVADAEALIRPFAVDKVVDGGAVAVFRPQSFYLLRRKARVAAAFIGICELGADKGELRAAVVVFQPQRLIAGV